VSTDFPLLHHPAAHPLSPPQGMAIYSRTLNGQFFEATKNLFALLEELGRTYNGTFDPIVLIELEPLAAAYGSAAAEYFE
jgi:hypothetical protein